MPATTPVYGFPYPTGTDRVMDGDNAIGALGLAVEQLIATLPIVDLRRPAAPVNLPLNVDAVVASYAYTSTDPELTLVLYAVQLNVSVSDAGVMQAALFLDNVALAPAAQIRPPASTGRYYIANFAGGGVVAAGAHTVELRVQKAGTSGTAQAEAATSMLTMRWPR
jgi:hypothetical protein